MTSVPDEPLPAPPGDASMPQWGKSPPENGERQLLSGPQERGSELLRTLRIGLEFIRGFRKLHWIGPCVTVFGSARFDEHHPYYAMGRELGAEISKTGFTVMTGGGPGFSSETLNIYTYNQAFYYFNFGYASALLVVFFSIVTGISLLVTYSRRRLEV